MTEAQENELAGMITDVAIDYANGHAVDFRIAAKAAVAFVVDATRTDARVVPADVCAALARMCKPLDESRLSGVTAEEDARCMVLISGYVLASKAQAPVAWQPIETAPKDGTRFMAWINGHAEFMHWQDKGNGSDRPIGWRDSFIFVYEQGSGPSHWMPLPAAPVTQIDASKEPK